MSVQAVSSQVAWTLVVTKPELPTHLQSQAKAAYASLWDLPNCSVLELPLFKLAAHESAAADIKQFLTRTSQNPAIRPMLVFVSPSSLQMGWDALNHQWPDQVLCGVMGPQSAQLALHLGVPHHLIVAPGFHNTGHTEDSAGLFSLIQSTLSPDQLSVMVCKGPRGREEFPLHLKDWGCQVEVVETYDRQVIHQSPDTLSKLATVGESLVLWMTSSESVQTLNQQFVQAHPTCLPTFHQSAKVLTTHARIADKCRQLGFAHVFEIATGIESVKRWFENHALRT